MTILKLLLKIFLFPGNIVLKKIGVTVEEDSGILRSFINSCVWGGLLLLIILKFI